jgi:ubiquinone/menaquinone biosynthesis C-methylase UbiE
MHGLASYARHYETLASHLGRPLHQRVVADVAAAELPVGAAVLDVGTGLGTVALLIADSYPHLAVSGVDVSAAMITIARSVEPALGVDPVDFRVADVVALPLEDDSVDLVVSSLSLHHWADPAEGLREVVRVLRPGGQAWIYDLRPIVKRAASTPGLGAEVELETPLTGTWWLNPIGRLVLRRPRR